MSPDPRTHCPPFKPLEQHRGDENEVRSEKSVFSKENHDTIGMIAMDAHGQMAAGTSSNGAAHKIPG